MFNSGNNARSQEAVKHKKVGALCWTSLTGLNLLL